MTIGTFSQHFSDLKDPRQSAKISYPLFDILFLAICVTIAGCESREGIEGFGEAHIDRFNNRSLFKQDLPVHGTIAPVISKLKSQEFQRCFIGWMEAVSQRSEGELIAIDGKVLRGSYDRGSRQSTIHMVSAFSTANNLVLGQVKTDVKSNEITATPKLIELLDIKGCLVSIDAMGCQTEIAQDIVDQGGDYLLAVKGNQATLSKAVQEALIEDINVDNLVFEKTHGLIEARKYHVLSADKLASDFPQWAGLKTIGVAIGYRVDSSGKESLDYRYYISSAELNETEFGSAVRGHWSIENSLHWVLDVSLHEDACQIYRQNGAEVMACMRHIALNMLRTETSKKPV